MTHFWSNQHFIQELLDDHVDAETVASLARRGFQRLAGASGVRNGGTERVYRVEEMKARLIKR
jgi:hypothetical protein